MPQSITLSFYSQQKDIWEGLTVRSAQKHFQIKFINIAIYCNNFFDIAIYRNSIFWPQYPALTLSPVKQKLTTVAYHVTVPPLVIVSY